MNASICITHKIVNIPTILLVFLLTFVIPLPQATPDLLSVTLDEFASSRILYKWNDACVSYLSQGKGDLVCFTQHNYFETLSFCALVDPFYLFFIYPVFCWKDILQFADLFTCWWPFRLFWGITNKVSLYVCVQVFMLRFSYPLMNT